MKRTLFRLLPVLLTVACTAPLHADTLGIKLGYGGRSGGAKLSASGTYGIVPLCGSAWTAIGTAKPLNLKLNGAGVTLSGTTDKDWASYRAGGAGDALLDRYLEDNCGHTLKFSGLDTSKDVTYDLCVSMSCDVNSTGKYYPVNVSGTWYTAGKTETDAAVAVTPAAGETVPLAKGLWGRPERSKPLLNANTLKITGLKATDGTLTLTVPGADRSIGRAGLAAVQLTADIRLNEKVTLNLRGGSVRLSPLTGTGPRTGTALTLNCLRPTTLKIDRDASFGSLTVTGTAPLTLEADGGHLRVFYGSDIRSETNVLPGAASLSHVTVAETKTLTIGESASVDSVTLLGRDTDRTANLIVCPSKPHLEWADAEIGVLFHFDLYVFDFVYNWRKYETLPSPKIFNPTALDTDQWVRAAKAMGAKYAILTAKHCPGFCLWPTKTIDYNISKSPYKNGKGDLIREFVDSCRKYGVKPGLYCSTQVNGYLRVYDGAAVTPESPVSQEEYGRIVKQQLTELWTNYGELFELWFDGGAIREEQGGFSLTKLLKKYQPNAIVFQGPADSPHTVRWVGNERGIAPENCWATRDAGTASGGEQEYGPAQMRGSPYGKLWCPGESDCTLRNYRRAHSNGWGWYPNQDHLVYSVPELMQTYRTSVGRNTNMLIGMVIDQRGLVPEADVRRAKEFTAAVRARYGTPTYKTSGTGYAVTVEFPKPTEIDRAILQEDIAFGERVLDFELQLRVNGRWVTRRHAQCIGHKQIIEFTPTRCDAVRLKVNKAKAEPRIRNLSVFAG